MNVVSLSALLTGRLYPPRKYSWYSFHLESLSTPIYVEYGREQLCINVTVPKERNSEGISMTGFNMISPFKAYRSRDAPTV